MFPHCQLEFPSYIKTIYHLRTHTQRTYPQKLREPQGSDIKRLCSNISHTLSGEERSKRASPKPCGPHRTEGDPRLDGDQVTSEISQPITLAKSGKYLKSDPTPPIHALNYLNRTSGSCRSRRPFQRNRFPNR